MRNDRIKKQLAKLAKVRNYSQPIVWEDCDNYESIRHFPLKLFGSSPDDNVYYIHPAIDKLKADNFKGLMKFINTISDNDENNHYIFILTNYANIPSAMSETIAGTFEIFKPIQLVNPFDRYDMTSNFFKITKLDKGEIDQFAEKYKIDDVRQQVAKLSSGDLVSKWLRLSAGDVVYVSDKSYGMIYYVF